MTEKIDPIPAVAMGRSETALHRIAPISSPAATNHGQYIFDNAAAETATRFSALATIFDPGTIRHLTEIGVTKGWTCLEIGAGGGTIADWLCDRVGPEGRVMATDIDTQYLNSLNKPNLDVRRHDIARDVLPEETFDLVHVRLVLVHLPERDEVLTRIVSALKPGGWLLAEEFDSLSLQPAPVIASTEIPIKTLSAMEQLMARRGVDLLYGRRLAARVRSLGLASVTAEGRLFMWEGQSKGADLTRANFEQIRNELIELGLITESAPKAIEFENLTDCRSPVPTRRSASGRLRLVQTEREPAGDPPNGAWTRLRRSRLARRVSPCRETRGDQCAGRSACSKAEMEALLGLPNVQSLELPGGKLAVHEEFPTLIAEAVQSFVNEEVRSAPR